MGKSASRFVSLAVAVFSGIMLSAGAPASPSPAMSLRVQPAFSSIGFSVYEFGVMKVEGSFRDFSSDIFYDPAHPERSRVNFTVQVTSVQTQSRTRDEQLRSDDFFDAQRFPTMTFVSTSVAAQADRTLQVTGDIMIRGVTRRITIPVRYLGMSTISDGKSFTGFESAFTLDRTEFGVNGSRWSGGRLLISKEVAVRLAIGATRE